MRARGQATVEAALGFIVFVTVLLLGVHFAEVGYLSLQLVEANNSALFDATAKKLHDVPSGDWNQYEAAVQAAGPRATAQYADLDGRRSTDGRAGIQQALTRARDVQVQCERAGGTLPTAPAMMPASAAYPAGDSGMLCNASARLEAVDIPRFFLDDGTPGGFFGESQWDRQPIVVCGAGRATRGQCQARFAILLDDWGLAGAAEREECALAREGGSGCANRGYYALVKKTYEAQRADRGVPDDAASALARFVVGRSPIDESHFYMSFRGSESGYTEDLGGAHGASRWETTPWSLPPEYRQAKRDACWLGHKCR